MTSLCTVPNWVIDRTLSGPAVDADIDHGIEPVARGGIEHAEVGDVESGEEVLLHVSDAGRAPAILVSEPTLHGAISKR